MDPNTINKSAEFYSSAIGMVNAQIIGNSCTAINLEMLEKHGRFDSAIFLGLGDGHLLESIGPRFASITVVEGSDQLITQGRGRFGALRGLNLINAYFEAYEPQPGAMVSCILANHVLEHLDDPVSVMRRTRSWLRPDGIAIFTVPSSTSLHRRIGVQLGILRKNNDLSEQDIVVGHQRVYSLAQLQADILAAGYKIIETGGFNIKLVSQAQMLGWPESLHEAIYRVSRECSPEICSNLYAVCRRS